MLKSPYLVLGLVTTTFGLAVTVGGCGSYDAPDATGGTTAAGGTTATGGSTAAGGTTSSGGSTAAGGTDAGTGGIPEPPEPTCENGTPCGGDAVGVWFAQGSCLPVTGAVDLSAASIGCPEAAVASGEIAVTGNWTVNADGTLSDNTSSTSEVVFELEEECKDVSGTVTQCPNIGLPLTAMGFDDVTCVDSTVTTGGCTCTGTATQQGGMGYVLGINAETSGDYTVADTTITVSGTGPDDLAYAFCVDGPFMIATPMTMTEIGTINGTIVLQKQE
jgi:hypothetical protein